jgi:hypothetical protein
MKLIATLGSIWLIVKVGIPAISSVVAALPHAFGLAS